MLDSDGSPLVIVQRNPHSASRTTALAGAARISALVAEGTPIGGRQGGDVGGRERDRDGGRVGEHVPGVGEQRQRAGDQGADDLDDRDGQG